MGNDLCPSEQLAVKYAREVENHLQSAVESAIKCGAELVKVKASLPHGEFGDWVTANMPIQHGRCNKYMKLSESKLSPGTNLNLKSEIFLLQLPPENREAVRAKARKSRSSSAEVKSMVDEEKITTKPPVFKPKPKMNYMDALDILHFNDKNLDLVKAAFNIRAKIVHPDKGGSTEKFNELVIARDIVLNWRRR